MLPAFLLLLCSVAIPTFSLNSTTTDNDFATAWLVSPDLELYTGDVVSFRLPDASYLNVIQQQDRSDDLSLLLSTAPGKIIPPQAFKLDQEIFRYAKHGGGKGLDMLKPPSAPDDAKFVLEIESVVI